MAAEYPQMNADGHRCGRLNGFTRLGTLEQLHFAAEIYKTVEHVLAVQFQP